MAKATLPAADNIPLRLRRRRDGSLALTDVDHRVSGPDRAFPTAHVLTPQTMVTLMAADVLTIGPDTVDLELANAWATYDITARRDNGELELVLNSAELSEPTPIDEAAAVLIQEERRTAAVAEVKSRYGIESDDQALELAVRLGLARAPDVVAEPKDGEV